MGAVCDVYDAITSDRPYKNNGTGTESVITKMAEWCKGHFDRRCSRQPVKSVGIYPTGSLVRLESGRLGVVNYSPYRLCHSSVCAENSSPSGLA